MKSNFHSNQILYIKGIGYGRLAINQNIDAVLFDPEMFRIDSDSPFGQS